MSPAVTILLTGFVILFLIMTIVWFIQLKTKNAGIVDAVWAFSFPLLTFVYYVYFDGYLNRQLLITALTFIWGARLGIYLFQRNVGEVEDIRYHQLRTAWGDKANLKMFFFFQFQAVLASLLSIIFLVIITNQKQSISIIEILGIIVWFIGIIGESIADNQLKQFKMNPASKGQICEAGLWKYSRHPNYFFEWLVWISYFIMALNAPYGWMTIFAPLLMLFLLLKVSGIPMTEELMLRSRGEKFQKYQETTSAFIPWFKKK